MNELLAHTHAHGLTSIAVGTLLAVAILLGWTQKNVFRWAIGGAMFFLIANTIEANALLDYVLSFFSAIAFMVAVGLLSELHNSNPVRKAKRQPTIEQMFDFEEVTQ